MRILSTLAAVVSLSALAFAQSPLTTTFANNNGNAAGGAIYFDLDVLDPAGVTIYNIDINTDIIPASHPPMSTCRGDRRWTPRSPRTDTALFAFRETDEEAKRQPRAAGTR